MSENAYNLFFLSHIPFIKESLVEKMLSFTGSDEISSKTVTRDRLKEYGGFTYDEIERIVKCTGFEDTIKRNFNKMMAENIKMCIKGDENYPEMLLTIPNPPVFLFYTGTLPKTDKPSLAVIGARECSYYGEETAHVLGELSAGYGIQLISGMARGIDSISQNAAINAGGYTAALLGGGPDICYPKESRKLYEAIKERGAVISEHPPGVQPLPAHFVMRNRLISGLSMAVCVIEAKEKSGTLTTVDAALEQGRDVYALPGRITDRASRGCNRLIAQGAGIITDPREFIESFLSDKCGMSVGKLKQKESARNEALKRIPLSYEEKLILDTADDTSFTIDDLMKLIPLDEQSILSTLFSLTGKGLIINMGSMRFRKTQAFNV